VTTTKIVAQAEVLEEIVIEANGVTTTRKKKERPEVAGVAVVLNVVIVMEVESVTGITHRKQ
jgi:hypothetical protein